MCAYVLVVSARLNGYTRLEPRGGIADAPYLFKVRCHTCLYEHGDFLYLAVVSNFRTNFLQCQRCGSGGYITLLCDFGVPLYHDVHSTPLPNFKERLPLPVLGVDSSSRFSVLSVDGKLFVLSVRMVVSLRTLFWGNI